MTLKDVHNINENYYDPNYTVSMTDIISTQVCKEGYCVNTDADDKLLKAILYLFGMDTNRPIYRVELESGAAHHSEFTDIIQHGGVIFQGYQRTDDNWKKRGKNITYEYLFGNKADMLVKMLNKE